MPAVTIRGQLGSGITEIGKEVARLLPGDYVDKEIIENIAQLVGHPVHKITDLENAPNRMEQRIKAVWARMDLMDTKVR